MIVLLPDHDSNVIGLLGQLTCDNWGRWMDGFKPSTGRLKIPLFTVSCRVEPAGLLSRLGMVDAFGPGRADFFGVTADVDLWLDSLIHQTFVRVNEDGTEATAATATRGAMSPPPSVEFVADRPFVYAIRDNQTGLILFIGTVANPS